MSVLNQVLKVTIVCDSSSATRNINSTADATTKAGKAAAKSGASFKNLAGAFTAMLVGAKVKQAIESIIKPSAALQFTLKGVQVAANLSAQELVGLKNASLAAADATIYGPLQAAESLRELVRATGDATAAQNVLTQSLGLAQAAAGRLQPGTAARHVGEFARAFGYVGERASLAAGQLDKIYAASKQAGIPIEEVTKVFGRLGLAAARGNQSLESVVSTFLVARRVIPSSLRLSTQLIRVFGELGKTKATKAFRQIGIEVKNLFTGELMQAPTFFKQLFGEFQKNAGNVKAIIEQAFGQAAVKPIIAVLKQMELQGTAVFDNLATSMGKSKGAIANDSNAMMDTTQGALLRLGEAWNNFKTILGDMVAPALTTIATGLKAVVDAVRWFFGLPLVGTLAKATLGFFVLKGGIFALQAILMGGAKIWAVTISNVREAGGVTAILSNAMGQLTNRFATTAVAVKATGVALTDYVGNAHAVATTSTTAAVGVSRLTTALTWLKGAWRSIAWATGLGVLLAYLPDLLNAAKKIGKWFAGWAQSLTAIKGILQRVKNLETTKYKSHAALYRATQKMLKDEKMNALIAMAGGGEKTIARIKANQKKQAMRLDNAFRAQMRARMRVNQSFRFGTKQFDGAVTRLEKLFKVKPAVVKASSYERVKNNLTEALAVAQKGGKFIRGGGSKTLTKAHVPAIKKALANLADVRKSINLAHTAKGGAKGKLLQGALQKLEAVRSLYGGVLAPLDTKGLKNMKGGLINPLKSMTKPIYRQWSNNIFRNNQGRDFKTGSFMPGISPFHTKTRGGNLTQELNLGAANAKNSGGLPPSLGGSAGNSAAMKDYLLSQYGNTKDPADKQLLDEIKKGIHHKKGMKGLLLRLVQINEQLLIKSTGGFVRRTQDGTLVKLETKDAYVDDGWGGL